MGYHWRERRKGEGKIVGVEFGALVGEDDGIKATGTKNG